MMTRLRATTVVFASACIAAPLWAQQNCMTESARVKSGSSQHWTTNDDDGRGKSTTIRWRRGDCEVRLDARGDFSARPDLTGFASVDNYVEIEERDGDRARKVRVTDANGRLEYRWSLDGANAFDVDRERWLADMLLSMERRWGLFAKTRVPYLIKQRGPDAVLDETARMESDYAKRQYFTILLANASLTEPQFSRILAQAADSMSSDYERAELVRAVAAKASMNDRLARGVIGVAGRMSSDYEKRRTLPAGLDAVATPASRTAFFNAASTMTSNYEIAELLIAAQKRSLVDSVSSDAYFTAVSRLNSDYELRRTLSALLKQQPLTAAMLTGILRASASIDSDYELATLLVEFARVTPIRGELRELYLKATRSISSDYEYRRALSALLDQDRQT